MRFQNLQYLASNDGPTAPETGIFVIGRSPRPVIGWSEHKFALLCFFSPWKFGLFPPDHLVDMGLWDPRILEPRFDPTRDIPLQFRIPESKIGILKCISEHLSLGTIQIIHDILKGVGWVSR